jgi:hypothetical protein
MPLPPVSARVANELLLKRVDKEWVFHKLPTVQNFCSKF